MQTHLRKLSFKATLAVLLALAFLTRLFGAATSAPAPVSGTTSLENAAPDTGFVSLPPTLINVPNVPKPGIEYKIISGNTHEVEAQLDPLGKEGWAIASSSTTIGGDGNGVILTVILKRQKPVVPDRKDGPLVEWPVAEGGNGHFYQAVSTVPGINWTDAQALATARGGYLATVASAQENVIVLKALTGPLFHSGLNYWIGGRKADDSTKPDQGWSWANGEGPLKYSNWDANEPNNSGEGENRLEIYLRDGAENGTWNDFPAPGMANGFVVEFNSKPQPQRGENAGDGAKP